MTLNFTKGACRSEHKISISSLLKIGRVGLKGLRHNGKQVEHKGAQKLLEHHVPFPLLQEGKAYTSCG